MWALNQDEHYQTKPSCKEVAQELPQMVLGENWWRLLRAPWMRCQRPIPKQNVFQEASKHRTEDQWLVHEDDLIYIQPTFRAPRKESEAITPLIDLRHLIFAAWIIRYFNFTKRRNGWFIVIRKVKNCLAQPLKRTWMSSVMNSTGGVGPNTAMEPMFYGTNGLRNRESTELT